MDIKPTTTKLEKQQQQLEVFIRYFHTITNYKFYGSSFWLNRDYLCHSKEWHVVLKINIENVPEETVDVYHADTGNHITKLKIKPHIIIDIIKAVEYFEPSEEIAWNTSFCEKGVYVDPNEGEIEITNCELKEKLSE